MGDIEKRLKEANGRLSSGGYRITIEATGGSLYLRAMLPPKPNTNSQRLSQQRIKIASATVDGVSIAEKAAKKLRFSLDENTFAWNDYLSIQTEKNETCREWAEAYRRDYFSRRAEDAKSLYTWRTEYENVFNKLPQDENLTSEILKDCILKTKPDTRTRKRFCQTLGILSRFAKLDFNTSPWMGNYSPKRRVPRDIPSDNLIAEWFYRIKPSWRWVYGMLATYGLRNHEVFFLDTGEIRLRNPIITVLQGKTGRRKIWPFHPEWVEEFSLAEVNIPNIHLARDNSAIGRVVTDYLRRHAEIPFQVYALRHAWAIRTLEYGLDITLSAQQMGHSLSVHANIYHAWINEKHHQKAFDKTMQSSSRPLPPDVLR